MKTIKNISVLLMAMVISSFALSCGSDDGGGGSSNVAEGVIKAKVNGSWVTTHNLTGSANLYGSMLSMSGATAEQNSKAFVFTITGFEGERTYVIGGANNVAVSAGYSEMQIDINNPMNSTDKTWQAPYSGSEEAGKIVVTEVTDTHVKGTFEFRAKNSDDDSIKNITEGSFYLKLN